MNINEAFAYLGIAITTDEDIIKEAYRGKLPENHPEDNPQGFQMLRKSYDMAMKYASKREIDLEEELHDGLSDIKPQEFSEQEQEIKNEVNAWVHKLEEIYQDYKRRIIVQEWINLLSCPAVNDLRTSEDIFTQLLRFLTDHFYVKKSVYSLINEKYDLLNVDKREEILSIIPRGFYDYIKYMVNEAEEQENWFDWFEGDSFSQVEELMECLKDTEELVYSDKSAEAVLSDYSKSLEEMQSLGLSHPYVSLLEIRYEVLYGDENSKKNASEKLAELLSKEAYANDVKVCVRAGELYYFLGEEALSKQWLEAALSKKNAPLAHRYLGLLAWKQKELHSAYTHIKQILNYYEDTNSIFDEVCDAICENWNSRESLDRNEENLFTYMEILWHRGDMQEARRVLEQVDYIDKNSLRYIKTLCMLCANLEDYERALELADLWEDCLKGNVQKSALAEVYIARGKIYFALAKEAYNRSDRKNYQKNKKKYYQCFEEAEKKNDNIDTKLIVAKQLLESEDYSEAYAKAEEILERDPDVLMAIVYKQQAAYERKQYQEVIDLFAEGMEIEQGYAPLYEYAAMTFVNCGMYQDADNILQAAGSRGLSSMWLSYIPIFIQYNQDMQLLKRASILEEWDRMMNEENSSEEPEYEGEFPEPLSKEERSRVEILQNRETWLSYIHQIDELLGGVDILTQNQRTRSQMAHMYYFQALLYYCNMGTESLKNAAECIENSFRGTWTEISEDIAERIYPALQTVVGGAEFFEMLGQSYGIKNGMIETENVMNKTMEVEEVFIYINDAINEKPDAITYWFGAAFAESVGRYRGNHDCIRKARELWQNYVNIAPEHKDDAVRKIKEMSVILGENTDDFGGEITEMSVEDIVEQAKNYSYQGKYETALYLYEKAEPLAVLSSASYQSFEIKAGKFTIYFRTGEFEKAQALLEKGDGTFDYESNIGENGSVKNYLLYTKQYDNALKILEHRRKDYNDMMYLYHQYQIKRAAANTMEERRSLTPEIKEYYNKYINYDKYIANRIMGGHQIYDLGELNDNTYQTYKDGGSGIYFLDKINEITEYMLLAWEMKNTEEINYWVNKFFESLSMRYKSEDVNQLISEYKNFLDKKGAFYNCAVLNICVGNYEAARLDIESIKTMNMCPQCEFGKCIEELQLFGIWELISGNQKGATEYFMQVCDTGATDMFSNYMAAKKMRGEE